MKKLLSICALAVVLALAGVASAQHIEAACPCGQRCACAKNFGVDWDRLGGKQLDIKLPLRVLECVDNWCNLPDRVERAFWAGGFVSGAAAASIAGVGLVLFTRKRNSA